MELSAQNRGLLDKIWMNGQIPSVFSEDSGNYKLLRLNPFTFFFMETKWCIGINNMA